MGRRPSMKTDQDSPENILQPTTFNGKLEQYSYSSTTTATTRTTGTIMLSPTKRITRSYSRALTPCTPPTSTLPPKPPTRLIPTPPSSTTSTTTSTSTFTPTPTNKKRKRPTPTSMSTSTSATKYAHIPNNLTDALGPSLILLFIGVNPGLTTALTGHAYAHPSNLFWKLLHSSHITPRRCLPSETHALPRLYGLGNTNIVTRPTRDASELSRAEMDAGVGVLEEKVRRWRPEAVCVVGKGIWEAIWRVRKGRALRREEFRYGWQDGGENMGRDEEAGWEGARVFVATTTSGLAAGMRPWEKEEVWRPLGEWVCRRRRERGWVVEGEGEVGGEEEGRVVGLKVEEEKEKEEDREAEQKGMKHVAARVEAGQEQKGGDDRNGLGKSEMVSIG